MAACDPVAFGAQSAADLWISPHHDVSQKVIISKALGLFCLVVVIRHVICCLVLDWWFTIILRAC